MSCQKVNDPGKRNSPRVSASIDTMAIGSPIIELAL